MRNLNSRTGKFSTHQKAQKADGKWRLLRNCSIFTCFAELNFAKRGQISKISYLKVATTFHHKKIEWKWNFGISIRSKNVLCIILWHNTLYGFNRFVIRAWRITTSLKHWISIGTNFVLKKKDSRGKMWRTIKNQVLNFDIQFSLY